MSDPIDRQAAIDALCKACGKKCDKRTFRYDCPPYGSIIPCQEHYALTVLPSAQPDGIPLEWINKHLEWLDNCDNDFAQLAKVSIRAMVECYGRKTGFNKQTGGD